MSNREFEAEKKYMLAVTIVKTLRDNGLLTEEEYREVKAKLTEEYAAKLSAFLSS